MTKDQKEQIFVLRSKGAGYTTIASAVGLSKGSVAAFCRRNGLDGKKTESGAGVRCPNCGSMVPEKHGHKPRKFCSDRCRMEWWKAHQGEVDRKAIYSFTCAHCGRAFTAYGNAGRKYCSHECYIADRFKGGECRA